MLGVFRAQRFPLHPCPRASSQAIISSLQGSGGPWVTVVSCPCRYEEIQRAREELAAGVVEVAAEARRVLAAVQQVNADMAERLLQVAAPGQVSSINTPLCIPTPCFTH